MAKLNSLKALMNSFFMLHATVAGWTDWHDCLWWLFHSPCPSPSFALIVSTRTGWGCSISGEKACSHRADPWALAGCHPSSFSVSPARFYICLPLWKSSEIVAVAVAMRLDSLACALDPCRSVKDCWLQAANCLMVTTDILCDNRIVGLSFGQLNTFFVVYCSVSY